MRDVYKRQVLEGVALLGQQTDKQAFQCLLRSTGILLLADYTRTLCKESGAEAVSYTHLVQRGGSPTLRDRVNASAMGYQAVCLLEQGKYNRIVGMKGEKLVDYIERIFTTAFISSSDAASFCRFG